MTDASRVAMLADRRVLSVSGGDARSFLQGLITNDINHVVERSPRYAALLSPQGKILFDFILFAGGDVMLIDCWASARDALQKRLSMYRLRANAEIKSRDDL